MFLHKEREIHKYMMIDYIEFHSDYDSDLDQEEEVKN